MTSTVQVDTRREAWSAGQARNPRGFRVLVAVCAAMVIAAAMIAVIISGMIQQPTRTLAPDLGAVQRYHADTYASSLGKSDEQAALKRMKDDAAAASNDAQREGALERFKNGL